MICMQCIMKLRLLQMAAMALPVLEQWVDPSRLYTAHHDSLTSMTFIANSYCHNYCCCVMYFTMHWKEGDHFRDAEWLTSDVCLVKLFQCFTQWSCIKYRSCFDVAHRRLRNCSITRIIVSQKNCPWERVCKTSVEAEIANLLKAKQDITSGWTVIACMYNWTFDWSTLNMTVTMVPQHIDQ